MNSENILSKFFKYGVIFFPLLLLVGPLVSELFLISIIIFFLFQIIKEKNSIFYKNKFLIFFSLFYISTVYSTLLNFYHLNNTIGAIFYFRIPLFAFSIWFILEKFDLFNKNIITLYILFFLSLISDSLLQFYSGKNILGNEIIFNRISSFFGDELILGSFLVKILPIFLVYLAMNDVFVSNKEKGNFIYILIVSLVCFVIFLSGERTSFFSLILFFLTLYFISKHLRKFILFIFSIFLILLATSSILPTKINPGHRMFVQTYNQVIGKNITNKKDEGTFENYKKKFLNKFYIFSHDHQGHYMLSYKIFKDYPLAGTGIKGFRYLCRNQIYILDNNDGCSTHPHNIYVQILVSNGLIGFFLIIFVFFYIVKEIFLSRKKINYQREFNKYDTSKAILIASIFVNFWPLIPSGNFFNNWLSMIYFYPIGFYLYFKHKTKIIKNLK